MLINDGTRVYLKILLPSLGELSLSGGLVPYQGMDERALKDHKSTYVRT
jgi:hypothetical protein